MSAAAAQANRFYEEVAETKLVWFAEDSSGNSLEFDVSDGRVAFPLWSSKSRIVRLRRMNPDLLKNFTPRQVSWSFFKSDVVPLLVARNRLLGVNYSGKNLSGFDLSIDTVIRQVEGVVVGAT